jgi:hypothetical protein
MPPADDLIVWTTLAVITAATDTVMARRRYAGKLGEEVRATYLRTAGIFGGTRNLHIITVVADLFLWPLGAAGCLFAWHRDWRTYQAELARAQARQPHAGQHAAPD